MFDGKEKKKGLLETKRRQICRGAMKVLRKKKFHAASMREIAEATEMSSGNLYHYIVKKEDILVMLYKDLANRIRERIDDVLHQYEHPVDQLVQVIRELFDLACTMKEETLVILTEARSIGRKDLHDLLRQESETVSAIEGIIERGVSQGLFHCTKPHLIANMIVFNIWIVPLRGWNILSRHNEKEVREQTIGCFLRELGVSKNSISRNSMNLEEVATNLKQSKKRKERAK